MCSMVLSLLLSLFTSVGYADDLSLIPNKSWFLPIQASSQEKFLQSEQAFNLNKESWYSLRIQQFFLIYANQTYVNNDKSFSLLIPQVWYLQEKLSNAQLLQNLNLVGVYDVVPTLHEFVNKVDSSSQSEVIDQKIEHVCIQMSQSSDVGLQQLGFYCLAKSLEQSIVNQQGSMDVTTNIHMLVTDIIFQRQKYCYYTMVLQSAWTNHVWSPWANYALEVLQRKDEGC